MGDIVPEDAPSYSDSDIESPDCDQDRDDNSKDTERLACVLVGH